VYFYYIWLLFVFICCKSHKKQPIICIEHLFKFSKTLNDAPSNFDEIDIHVHSLNDDMMDRQNYNLNLYIQKDELIKCIQKFKNNKAGGEDTIINEYTTSNQFIEIYEKLFSLIFDTGFIPESWVVGNIIPIYKNKGDSNDPKNFRPITLVSCLGKHFTAISSERD